MLRVLLDANYVAVEKYIPQRFIDEMDGLAAGAGVSVWLIRQLNMVLINFDKFKMCMCLL